MRMWNIDVHMMQKASDHSAKKSGEIPQVTALEPIAETETCSSTTINHPFEEGMQWTSYSETAPDTKVGKH